MTENKQKNDGVNENSQEQKEIPQNKAEMLKKMNDVVNSKKMNTLAIPVEVKNLAKAALTNENKKNIKGIFFLSTVLDKAIDISKKIGNYALKHPIKTVLMVASAVAMLSGVVIPIESIANTSAFLSGIATGGGTWGTALSSAKALSLIEMPGITSAMALLNTAAIVGVPLMAFKLGKFVQSKLFNKGHELAKSEFTNMPNVSAQEASQEIQANLVATTTEPNIQQQELPQEMQKEPVEMAIQQNSQQDSIYQEQMIKQLSLLFESIKDIKEKQSLPESEKERFSNFFLPQLEKALSPTIPENEKIELLKKLNLQMNKYTDELKRMEAPTNFAPSDNMVLANDITTKQEQSQLFKNPFQDLKSANDHTINNITHIPRPKG
jgi:hypothetical protein